MSVDTGRSSFQRYESILLLLVKFFSVTPGLIKRIVWSFFDGYEGKVSVGVRYCLFASAAKSCGRNVFIGRGVVLKNIENLAIGDNVSIHAGCYVDAFGGVEIGDNVSIAHHSSIVSFEHTWEDPVIPIKYNKIRSTGIHIAADVWIGCGVRVLDGCVIGRRVVVAAGSVAKGDLEGFSLYGGVPVKRLKSFENPTIVAT